MRATRILLAVTMIAALAACSSPQTTAPEEAPQRTIGNGEANWIVTDGAVAIQFPNATPT